MRNDYAPRRSVATMMVIGLAIGSVLTAAVWYLARPRTLEVTASFARVVGLYQGDDVRILGVKVGSVSRIDRERSQVLVRLEVDHGVSVPSGAEAVVVAPTLVSGRYVQLTPVYRGGAKMASGTVIPESRTYVPTEFDELKGALDQLGTNLGPDRKNGSGPLSRAVDTASANLDGQGKSMHDTVTELSAAVTTLSDSRGDLFTTVHAMAGFTTMLADTNEQMKSFTTQTATLSGQLADSRKQLGGTLDRLDKLEPRLQSYLKENTPILHTTSSRLETLSTLLGENRQNVADILQVAPTAMSNTYNIYDPAVKGQVGSLVLPYTASAGQIICWMFGVVGAADLCPKTPAASNAVLNKVVSGTTTTGSVASLLTNRS